MSLSVKDVKNDKFAGSFELSQNALICLSEFIESNSSKTPDKFVDECNKFAKELIKSQPNMVTIRKKISAIIYHMKRLLKVNKSVEEIQRACKLKITEILKVAETKRKKIGNVGGKLIFNQNKVLTISASSLIKEIFISAQKINRKFSVYCLESRPQNEGHLLAEELTKRGIPCVLTTDAMMAQVLKEVNMVLCGADRIFESGFVNKTGTLPLAITAKSFQVPLYIAAETDKILKEIDRSLRFYPQDPAEVFSRKNNLLTVSNYYFEDISFDYVHKIICEDGVFDINEFKSWYLED